MKEQLLFNLNYVKESYDVLNRTVTGLQKTNSERENALTMMNATMMPKQKAINHYIEENAELKQELEKEKIENERIRRLLQGYSSSDYLIDRIYPTVAGFEAFKDDKLKKKDTGGSAEEEQKKPFWRQSNQEFLAEMKRKGTGVFQRKDTRTYFKCNEAGHIASTCSQMTKPKQGVSEKLKEKVVDIESPTEKLKFLKIRLMKLLSVQTFTKRKPTTTKCGLLRRVMRKSAMNLIPQNQWSQKLRLKKKNLCLQKMMLKFHL
ncbi:putative transcription factor interactor and regulator CCHC(Zn) family [Helianthus annuus]|nr:putative transcription factor interactor and regulator CCHC(Zn) family [Helianthus annuus]KAJ0618823.1 putative transcription factor interactor and regulator CCHC(Zn) family [Helianthus annuus]KAJ0777279.1 putative transcription factor interactor and regulator CCHC(Zn) family [Helianthus annuus]